jgi:hypothetical protein
VQTCSASPLPSPFFSLGGASLPACFRGHGNRRKGGRERRWLCAGSLTVRYVPSSGTIAKTSLASGHPKVEKESNRAYYGMVWYGMEATFLAIEPINGSCVCWYVLVSSDY